MRAAKDEEVDHAFSASFLQEVQNAVGEAYNDGAGRLPREQRPDGSAFMDVLNSEMHLGIYSAAFWRKHRNVIAIDPALVTLLEHTDAEDLPLSAVRHPFPFFYVAFPARNGMALPGPANELDGAYVDTRHDGVLQLLLVSRRLDRQPSRRTYPRVVEHVVGFSGEPCTAETVGGFVSRVTEEKLDSLRRQHGVWAGIVEQANASEIGRPAGRLFSEVAEQNNVARAATAEEVLPLTLKAVSLLMNVLCYLSTEHVQASDWSPRPPLKLQQRLNRGTGKQRRQAREDALRLAILPIRVVGRDVLTDAERAILSDRTVRPHWRRGHIRRVQVGAGRERTEVRWIRPLVVNSHKGDPVGVHVHILEPAGSNGDQMEG